jgi:purine nucleoside permease
LALYLRDGLACVYCGASVEDATQLTLDHLTPVSKGGKNEPGNLATCCKRCNSSRGTRSVPAFARAVAGYVNHGVTAAEILTHVRNTVRRTLPRIEARELIARRGSVARVLAQK